MNSGENDIGPTPQTLATAHAGQELRQKLSAFFGLDARLAQFVSQSREPMLTQMRIAWWRDQFGKPVADRPSGDLILDQLSHHWAGEEDALIGLVDGWEALLADAPLPDSATLDFANGRAGCFAALCRLSSPRAFQRDECENAFVHGQYWALADLAVKLSDEDEKACIVAQSRNLPSTPAPLPYKLRALTILGRLGENSLRHNGAPMIGGRGEILLVLRLGLFGR